MLQSLWRRNGILGAAFRLIALIAGASALIVVVSIPLGLVSHSTLSRSISLGFYGAGAFLVVLGLAAGSRGPFRRVSEDPVFRVERKLRRATLEEMVDTINVSTIMVFVGFVLIVVGVAIDDRYRLV